MLSEYKEEAEENQHFPFAICMIITSGWTFCIQDSFHLHLSTSAIRIINSQLCVHYMYIMV